MKIQFVRKAAPVEVTEDGTMTIAEELDADDNMVVEVTRKNPFARDEILQLTFTEAETTAITAAAATLFA